MAPKDFFPPAPLDLDWDNIGIKVREVNGHVECAYNVATESWSEPQVVKGIDLTISGLSPALNYGQQAYEGMKAFRDPQGQIHIFRPEVHAARMAHSCEVVSIPPIPQVQFIRSVALAVSVNAEFVPPFDSSAALYIRPLAFGSGPQINLAQPEEYTFCVFVLPVTSLLGTKPVDALIMEEFDRTAPMGSGNAKVGGNYAPVLRWAAKARARGYGIPLHLDSKTRTEIDEFSAAGFIGVRDDDGKTTIVVPDSSCIIQSVTSDSCVQLARSYGWSVEVRPIKYTELPEFSEVLAVGTAAVIVPIGSITRDSLRDLIVYKPSEDGGYPCADKLFKSIKDIQRGLGKDVFNWCVPVHEPGAYFQPVSA
ncbi:Aminotransferase atnJ [Penicillium oxalicum]|uniref:Aminotransferase poxL n=1 Tax=Penicillium oxalicum (strain 114-2 / CGMCC 5302) TaxID=933388 RepID=POXL_PENO1|nr:Aminotransferase atnJ [Penicillium oxalicum]S7ZEI5.1 RecName: Full=Aminotransferase poxL; AltName: Full=Oxaleimides biosynthesis cluster protein L [Penicillium oxalicum 114-2]EPS29075.1 hypothetical protein PDE_04024 [Penicillium oxalicum 114-2]KAI2787752.1 Aminotransferase atnJ [Penicillium oxalicum]